MLHLILMVNCCSLASEVVFLYGAISMTKFNNLKVKRVKSNLKYTESKLVKKYHSKRKIYQKSHHLSYRYHAGITLKGNTHRGITQRASQKAKRHHAKRKHAKRHNAKRHNAKRQHAKGHRKKGNSQKRHHMRSLLRI